MRIIAASLTFFEHEPLQLAIPTLQTPAKSEASEEEVMDWNTQPVST